MRSEVQDNLALIEEIKKDQLLSQHSPAIGMLSGKIVLDVAKLSGQPFGVQKKPIPWGGVIWAAVFGIGLGWWAYLIDRNGFVWYSVFPGTAAFLFLLSILGMTTNRQIPVDPDLPEGASPIRSETAAERVASSVQFAASGADARMFEDTGQVGVALRFIDLMGNGEYEDALGLADQNWSLCRIQARLWNMCCEGSIEVDDLPGLAESLQANREPAEFWNDYVEAEAEQFKEAWGNLDASALGAASRRRRMSREYDLVILVPLEATGGYFVSSATALPNAMTFLMHRVENRWLVANHVGTAPPTPGFPPSWWTPADSAFANLPEA
ncbi:hypothetical protein B5P43_15520 [Bacillus sp. SRB_336]|nr:hypothetical protein B5P43_15520 [Bacillus sp. SRB_336]